MERRLLLLEGETVRGELCCRDEGCYLLCSVDAPVWEDGVKKVWLCGEGGGRLLLGTLLPERGRYRLSRRLSHSSLRCCGLHRLSRAEVNPGPEACPWRDLAHLSPPRDAALARALRSAPQGLWRRDGDRLLLRFPWQPGEPVPLMSLFCFGRATEGWWELSLPWPG